MTGVFYERFTRHSHGEGLKGLSTHYCAGCGHGLIHKYLAESITELGIEDRTVAISPVGCAVFMYYYLDVGNTQAAHGRAPAVGLGHKLANPNSVVVSYQGDGDLASIGLAEIMQATQLGIPMTFIFINNAIYGMTGGQMAPTSLMEQRTTTSPSGRGRMEGGPMRMAEIVAQLDGPMYIERCALYDNKQRVRAHKAIKKALTLQMEGRGLSFIEILSECPTHWHMTPVESEQWVKETMTAVFPLGVKKDEAREPWFHPDPPRFDAEHVVDTIGVPKREPTRYGAGFPTHMDELEVGVKFAGSGGDGAQTIAAFLNKAAINEGFDSTYIPSYGPESRGGTSYADIRMAVGEVLSPSCPEPHALIAFNPMSLEKFGPAVRPGGVIVYDSTVIPEPPSFDTSVKVIGVPCTEAAMDIGKRLIKNIVALGAFVAATEILPAEALLSVMEDKLGADCTMLAMNTEAFNRGMAAAGTSPGTVGR